MIETFGIKFIEVYFIDGKKEKFIVLFGDGEPLAEFPAKDFQKWLEHKAKEIKEWIKTGKITKSYTQQIEVDKDRLGYMG